MHDRNAVKDVYFISICGTGMTALAGLMKASGLSVRGSDTNVYPPMSTFLEEMDIPVHVGFNEANLSPTPDLVVVGNAMSRGNVEVEAVLDNKLNYTSLPLALKEFFIRGKYSCVVAGTHGKTTVSALLSWVLEKAGKDPGFFIGGIPENFGQGYKLGRGEVFISEGDEYDSAFFDKGSKFLHYMPDLAILTNIEFDHADIFRTIEDIELTFKRFINLIPRSGYLISCWDNPMVRQLARHAFSNVITFGLKTEAEWQAQNIASDENATQFDVYYKTEYFDQFSIPLHGSHMVSNGLSVIAACHTLGLVTDQIKEGLATFKNVRRRVQFCGEGRGIKVFDDFAHHPTEVAATLDGLRTRFPSNRLWALYEPRTATSKRKIFENKYVTAFESADRVVLAPLHAPEKVPAEQRLSVTNISEKLRRKKKPSWVLEPNSKMLAFLVENLKADDVVLFMSNGDFNQMPKKLLSSIQ